MRRGKGGEWKPSIRKLGSSYYIDIEELETFFDVRAEMRAQELDEWFSQNDIDDLGVQLVGAEIDGGIEELDYLIRVLTYLRNSHILDKVKNVEQLLENFPAKSIDKTEE
jgi:hypothetical protein